MFLAEILFLANILEGVTPSKVYPPPYATVEGGHPRNLSPKNLFAKNPLFLNICTFVYFLNVIFFIQNFCVLIGF